MIQGIASPERAPCACQRVEHVCGDVLELPPASLGAGRGSFDVLTSWLVFLHIERKRELLSRCSQF